MLLSHKNVSKNCPEYSNIIGHMCYAASKLWNVCNYERRHYKELGLENILTGIIRKSIIKEICGTDSFPAQTAQETCKQLDKAWKIFYALKRPRDQRSKSALF